MRELRRTLVDAPDVQITQVVSLIDSMPERGAADLLIEPLRKRLSLLRPPRPANFTRLLFQPLTPIIMTPTRWANGSLGIPRTALTPLASMIREAMQDDAEHLITQIAGYTIDDPELRQRLGPFLWSRAADILSNAAEPVGWKHHTGLDSATFLALSRATSTLLSHAGAIETLVQNLQNSRSLDSHKPHRWLAETAETIEKLHPSAAQPTMGMVLAILMAQAPQPGAMLAAATHIAAQRTNPMMRLALDQALDVMLDKVENHIGQSAEIGSVVDMMSRFNALLNGMEHLGPTQSPSRMARAENLRHQTDLACRARFEETIHEQIVIPMMQSQSTLSDAQIITMEATARELKKYAAAGRALTNTEFYDTTLKKHVASLMQLVSGPPADRLAERARLVEILMGSDLALKLLGLTASRIR
jgi:hypothetical protein